MCTYNVSYVLCRYIDYEKLYTQLLLQSTSLQPSTTDPNTASNIFPSSSNGTGSGSNDSSREVERLVEVVGAQADEIDLLK